MQDGYCQYTWAISGQCNNFVKIINIENGIRALKFIYSMFLSFRNSVFFQFFGIGSQRGMLGLISDLVQIHFYNYISSIETQNIFYSDNFSCRFPWQPIENRLLISGKIWILCFWNKDICRRTMYYCYIKIMFRNNPKLYNWNKLITQFQK